ncbi:MAG: DVUA0089 family protein [Nitrosospira sp.]|nr:DVUA0089 family protein [Nitrosospira sp.]
MKVFRSALVIIGLAGGSAFAGDFSFTGDFTNDDEVQPFSFTVTENFAEVTLRTWSYAGGTNAAGAEIARGGFDPILTLFDASTGALINENDDGHMTIDPLTGNGYDSFLMNYFDAGSYIATVTQFESYAIGPLLSNGFVGSANSNFDNRDSHWAFDIVNVSSASAGAPYISPIPEPGILAMFLAGLGLLGWRTRSARAQL